MKARRVKEEIRPSRSKYLITWSLTLGQQELAKISSRPDALDKALEYVQGIARDNELEVYRFVPLEEFTRRTRRTLGTEATASGIAIARAGSVEEAGKMIQDWVNGLSYGGIPVGDYLEYEIKPLADITGTRRS